MRGAACPECMVSVLLGVPGPFVDLEPGPPSLAVVGEPARWEGEQADGTPLPDDLDPAERRALGVLAAAGIVAGLRSADRLRRAG